MINVSIGQEVFKRFALTISRQPLEMVAHAPEPWARQAQCIQNVWDKVERDGGRPMYGWAFLIGRPQCGPFLIAMHHAVWRGPAGGVAPVDITPFHEDPFEQPHCPNVGSITFLSDDVAQPLQIGRLIAPLPSRFFPASDDPELAEYVAKLGREEVAKSERLYGDAFAARLRSERRQ